MKSRLPFIGALAIIIAASIWGIDGVILRPSLYHLEVSLVVFLEHFFALMILSVFLFREIPKIKRLKRDEWVSFFWIALFGGAIGTMAITQALFLVNFEQLSVIIILQKLQPMFAILLAALILKEKPRKSFYLWAVAAIAGSYLITFGFSSPVIEGNALVLAAGFSLLAAFSFGSSTVFGKKAVNTVDFKLTTYVRFLLTSLIMLVIIIVTGSIWTITGVGVSEITTLIIIAIFTGSAATFLYYFGLMRVLASKATIYELAFPVTAVLLDFLVHGSVMSPPQWLGAIMIIGSMLMITRKK
jgi:drug/metabolite transporter (DMT)-like permease